MFVYNNLEEVISGLRGIILDVYGVFWDGISLIPGSLKAMEQLKEKKLVVAILSNSPNLAKDAVANYEAHGLKHGKHFDFVMPSGEIAKKIITNKSFNFPIRSHRYFSFCRPTPNIFKGSQFTETQNLEEADFIYVGPVEGSNGKRYSLEDIGSFLPTLKRFINAKKPLFCTNPDYQAQFGERIIIVPGTLAHEYEKLGGIVQWCGKPYQDIFEATINQFKDFGILSRDQIAMVGDTIRTDIKGGFDAGLKTILVRDTGVTAVELAHGKTIEMLCNEEKVKPDFVISRLGSE
jgi:HAD superfamily hydrolase (TIGR01459 family)